MGSSSSLSNVTMEIISLMTGALLSAWLRRGGCAPGFSAFLLSARLSSSSVAMGSGNSISLLRDAMMGMWKMVMGAVPPARWKRGLSALVFCPPFALSVGT